MKLTKRQQTFINKLLELYKTANEPIHYSEVAELLEVSRFTAYDMLRVLEEKGFVTSEYQMPEGSTSRSIRVFIPTKKAEDFISVLTDEHMVINWGQIDESILSLVEQGFLTDAEIGLELFARIPSGQSEELHFCLEVISILLLRARNNKHMKAFQKAYQERVQPGNLPYRTVLTLFTGFALGVLAPETPDDIEWQDMLITNVMKFQELLLKFSDEQIIELTNHIQEHLEQALHLLENK